MWLSFGGEAKELIRYADADSSMGEDRHALSGYTYLIDGSAVFWSMKRQEIVSLLITESEYVATTHTTKEGLWLQLLITQLFSPLSGPTTFFWTISPLSQLLKIISTMPRLNTLTSASTSSNGSLKMVSSASFIALPPTWSPTCSLRLSHHPRSSTSHLNSDSATLEGKCWSKRSRVICLCHPYYPICLTIKYHYALLHSNL